MDARRNLVPDLVESHGRKERAKIDMDARNKDELLKKDNLLCGVNGKSSY